MTKRSQKEQLDYKKIRDNFLSELTKASQSQPSSISYFKHAFPKKPVIQTGLVQAFVIGGTNFDVSLARISEKREIKEIKKERKKGTIPNLANAKTFLTFIKKYLHPQTKAVAINFAYPLKPTTGSSGEVDGILQNGGIKEHRFKGLIGKPIGETIKQVIKKDIPITVVNDTVCLGTNGLVVGTGVNLCLNNVNLEAGNFNKFPATEELETIDKKSAEPGEHRFEKMLSGGYLPLHFNLIAKKQKLAVDEIKSGKDLSNLAEHDFGAAGDLSRTLFIRSASLIAAELAGAYLFVNKKILTITTEGSLFWKGWQFENNVKKQLEALGIPQGAIRFKKMEDSSIHGAFNLLTRTK